MYMDWKNERHSLDQINEQLVSNVPMDPRTITFKFLGIVLEFLVCEISLFRMC
jgi:hypothetical protein